MWKQYPSSPQLIKWSSFTRRTQSMDPWCPLKISCDSSGIFQTRTELSRPLAVMALSLVKTSTEIMASWMITDLCSSKLQSPWKVSLFNYLLFFLQNGFGQLFWMIAQVFAVKRFQNKKIYPVWASGRASSVCSVRHRTTNSSHSK